MTDTAHQTAKRPVVLCILDGWGYREELTNNAIALGKTPTWDKLVTEQPTSLLSTSGEDVGLPEGQMGNSEVGHMTIGSGRVILQDLPRINSDIHTGALKENTYLKDLIAKLKISGGTCHIAGLLSPGGVHSHQDHMIALAQILDAEGIPVNMHGFMDGRDTPPTSGAEFVETVEKSLAELTNAKMATLCGRYYAMDRDKNWDRVSKAWNAIFHATGSSMTAASEAVVSAYADDEKDEFLNPRILEGYQGIQDGDAFLMANFRADRARQFLSALVEEEFDGFERGDLPSLVSVTGMVEYSADLAPLIPALFPPVDVVNTLGEVVSKAGKNQLRIAETEKYAHVTFFLNGGEESVYAGEERILVPSPKVATYDLQPEMSAPEVLKELVDAIQSDQFDLIVVNFANPDMVGHSGILEAAIKAVETIDNCLDVLSQSVSDAGGVMLVTADHGNIELMKDPVSDKPHTAHTTNLVPLVLAVGDKSLTLKNGTLADLAPTVLDFLDLEIPKEMSGKVLTSSSDQTQETRAAS